MLYIQSDSDRQLPEHFDAACALYGARDLNIKTRLTSFDEVAVGKFDLLVKQHVFVGSTEYMREVFNRVGKTSVGVPCNSNRECEIITLGNAHLRVAAGERLFIKPIEIKQFTGLVLDGFRYSCLALLPDDTKVMAYKPFDSEIVTEWRVYVHKHEILDSRNYAGDFTISPDYNYVHGVIEDNKQTFPIAYTIDVAVLASGEMVVVEFNDMWEIGNYGVPNDLYVKALRDRYFEIING
jgi:hypothetical protein